MLEPPPMELPLRKTAVRSALLGACVVQALGCTRIPPPVVALQPAAGHAPAAAPPWQGLEVGGRIRVEMDQGVARSGSIAHLSSDSLVLSLDDTSAMMAIPASAVRRVEASRGRRSLGRSTWLGVKWGAVCGAVIGGVGAVHNSEAQFIATAGPFIGAAFGAPIGLVVGLVHKPEEWRRIWP